MLGIHPHPAGVCEGQGLSAARIHGPPGPVELPGVDAPFVWPAFQQTVRTAVSTTTKVDVPSGAYRSPVCCNAVRFSIGSDDRERPRQAAARRLSYNRSKSNGREGTGIGNAVGIRLCGVRRRHLFGCQGALSVLMGAGHPRLRDYQRRIHTARVQRGGVNPRPCARGFGAMSLWPVSDWPVGSWLKLALVGSIAHPFWRVSRRWMSWSLPKFLTCTFAYMGCDRCTRRKSSAPQV